MQRRVWFALLALLIGIGLAQNAVEIEPANAFLPVAPGQTQSGAVTVRNPGAAPATIDVFTQDFWITPEGGLQMLPAGSLPNSLTGWLRFAPANLELAPKGESRLRYTLNVPTGAKPGTYWGAIVFRPRLPETRAEGISIQPIAQVAFILYANVGESKVQGAISSISVAKNSGKAYLELAFDNSGSTYLYLTGTVELRDSDGQLKARLKLPARASLPQNTVIYRIPLKDVPPGRYLALAVLNGEVPHGRRYAFTGQARIEVP